MSINFSELSTIPFVEDNARIVCRDANTGSEGVVAGSVVRGGLASQADLESLETEFDGHLANHPGGGGGEAYTGEVRFGFFGVAPAGWIMCYGSLGDTGSGSDYEGSTYEALYEHLWDNLADTYAPVSGGRGASATADFAAGKTLTMPDFRGRMPLCSGQGGGLTERALGETLGEESHTLDLTEIPSHGGHGSPTGSVWGQTSGVWRVPYFTEWPYPGQILGGDQPHNNMSPALVVSVIIKL